ncbi:DUF3784 domain-containing protein [Dyadobacter pollutisoli]|jgi:hypothetical protein|uniref:DUF3784 domain-containing protein n=1 Tax=Dyadobacter pollutisoli TaxID=2910158 RepID=A0A9E8NAN0_9BACT|nr:DUF3784 domain-containing protein [Dyadobacter pollutisoli]WAC13055.1 DUF3784 domain-containing protein [Dyadobacter pollutisoli]
MLLGVVYLIIGIIFITMSLVTWRFEWLGIIAGYDEKKVLDKKGLAAWFGKCTMGLSICAGLLSIICFYVQPFHDSVAFIFGISFTTIVLVGTAITLSGMSKYYKF